MPERGPGSEEESEFRPALDLSEIEPKGRMPINDEPIELTEDEDRLRWADVDPESEDVRRFMEAKGIPYGAVVKVKVGDKVFNINTDPKDFGTRVQ